MATGGELRLEEGTGNGTYVGLKAPDTEIVDNVIWSLPSTDGATGQALVTDGNKNLNWADMSSIDAEITARENADSTLTANLDSEVTARENADATLQLHIEGLKDETSTFTRLLGVGYVLSDYVLHTTPTNLSSTTFSNSNSYAFLINPESDFNLGGVRITLRRAFDSPPYPSLCCKVYGYAEGTNPNSQTLLATSYNNFDLDTLPLNSNVEVQFKLPKISLVSSTPYWVIIEADTTGSSLAHIQVKSDISGGVAKIYTGGIWEDRTYDTWYVLSEAGNLKTNTDDNSTVQEEITGIKAIFSTFPDLANMIFEYVEYEKITLTASDIVNGYVDLSSTPRVPGDTFLWLKNGTVKTYSDSFEVISNGSEVKRLDWNGPIVLDFREGTPQSLSNLNTTTQQGYGQTITTASASTVSRAIFDFSITGSPEFDLTCYIYTVSGGLPNILVETSDTVTITNQTRVTFTFPTPASLLATTQYAVVYIISNVVTLDYDNKATVVGRWQDPRYALGTAISYNGTTWAIESMYNGAIGDLHIRLLGVGGMVGDLIEGDVLNVRYTVGQ